MTSPDDLSADHFVRAESLQREVERRVATEDALQVQLSTHAKQLAAADDLFRLLVESVTDYAIFMLDPDGRVSSWNPGAERIKGYRADEIIGSHFSRFYPVDDVRAGKCEHELEVAARVGRFEDEGWRLRQDGSRFWANVVLSAVRDGLGQLVGFSKVTRDLTERIRSEEERAARLAAEEANRTKDEFLAMLGHELRNPLAPIVSAIQLLKLRGDGKSVREHQVIERQVNQMIRLVDDLLDVSRVTRGKIVLKTGRIELREVLAGAVEIAIPGLEKKEQPFHVDVPDQALIVDGDSSRLIQVFTNLLNNASKFTPERGAIALAVRATDHQVMVEIRDDGVGIDAELLPRVFELFTQGYQHLDRAQGGLGIGLALVRSLVERHGGSVEAHSAGRGHGSRFTVTLPRVAGAVAAAAADEAAITDRPARADLRAPAPPRRRILLVDDNEDSRSLLAEILREVGHEVETAADGAAALALLPQFRPEVAVLDIGLPDMDGHQLASKIRAAPGPPVRLVALSGYGQPDDRARGAQSGFDAYLVKPLEIRRLLAQIDVLPPS